MCTYQLKPLYTTGRTAWPRCICSLAIGAFNYAWCVILINSTVTHYTACRKDSSRIQNHTYVVKLIISYKSYVTDRCKSSLGVHYSITYMLHHRISGYHAWVHIFLSLARTCYRRLHHSIHIADSLAHLCSLDCTGCVGMRHFYTHSQVHIRVDMPSRLLRTQGPLLHQV